MRLSRLAIVAAVGLGMTLVPPAQAHSGAKVVASGLDNPRGLTFDRNGALFVAEAGTGGSAPCLPNPEGGDEVCWGKSGKITKLQGGKKRTAISRLPSIAVPDGSQAIGPSDVAFDRDGKMFFTVGLGADPAVRAQLPKLGREANGWLLRGKSTKHGAKGAFKQVADIAGHEATENPDGTEPDSNPNSVATLRNAQVVADAGGNSLVRVNRNGRTSTLATFDARQVPAPPFLGLPPGTEIPMQSVPTSVVRGPDGAFYVGELTGFPFAVGEARIFRVVPGKAPKVYADGLTNVIDIGFDRKGRLYALEIAHGGLLGAEEDPRGALLRVRANGNHRIIAHDELTTPGGLAIRGDKAYVSNCSVCAGDGQVLRLPLR